MKRTTQPKTAAAPARVDPPANDPLNVLLADLGNDPDAKASPEVAPPAPPAAPEVPAVRPRVAVEVSIARNLARSDLASSAVTTTRLGVRQSDIDERHVRALELYQSARNDLRDLKLAEHDVVRRREEAIAMCCDRMVGKEDNLQRDAMKDGTRYKHSKESATAWAYANDRATARLQDEREAITSALLYAEAACDVTERALNASHALLLREDATIVSLAVAQLAGTLTAIAGKVAT